MDSSLHFARRLDKKEEKKLKKKLVGNESLLSLHPA